MTELTLSIYDPNTLLPHRAGIAGLALALSSMPKEKALVKWEITEDEVKLAWECIDREAVQWLVKNTYRIADGGYLDVPALKLDRQGLYSFTEGVTSTFLQHSKQRKRDNNSVSLAFQIDEGSPEVRIDFRPLLECYYTGDLKDAFNTTGAFKSEISLKGHHLPGLVECFVNGAYQESPQNFIALIFTPLACSYHKLPEARSALVIPEINNLTQWIYRKQELSGRSYRNFRTSSAGESGLQFLWREALIDDADKYKVEYCEVYQLGKQTWDGNQSYLKQAVYRIRVKPENIQIYDSARQFFPLQIKTNDKKENETWLALSKTLPWICDNLIADKPWYSGFYEFRKRNVLYERTGLVKMTENYLNVQEQILFDAIQGAFSAYLRGQIVQAQKQGRKLDYGQVTDKVIYRFQRPSTQQEFASALVDFLSQFRSKAASGMGAEIYAWIHRESQWKQARDLALLAIATYKSKKGDPLDGQEISIESSPEIEPEENGDEDI
ncbi:type I-MYXAN CRISPR-associated Cas8a1/Cmx1 [Chamaesiphon sp. OTE_75_metabat_556]|uniref:type I-MYXAN CRISPR-associated Cas8a1/Cmx1 n=1 Tax=Chamaesiphon sp. OTE_75_metabat_556 TaxID=2964692 RepID=UPI00286B82E2|nr:type I-MYXAN CRISPR-associated Cas8a1/Cmx1 [Chamaesiphon sp. OTE_75_metabat_556]